ncbi:MAG: GNAT family N-acetyltransferase [Pirellulales bacterium]
MSATTSVTDAPAELGTGFELRAAADVATAEQAYRVEHVASLAEFDAHESAWRGLDSLCGGPIEQFAWVRSCAATMAAGEQLSATTVWRGERLVAAAPLVVARRCGVRRGALVGVERHYEPMDLLSEDAAALQVLADSLAKHGEPFALGRVRSDSPTVEAIKNAAAGRALVKCRPQIGYPYIDLDATWAEPEQNLNAKRRSDLRRAHRRAEETGEVTTEIIAPNCRNVDALLDEAFAVEMNSWKGKDGTAMACDAAEAAFCRAYARAACRHGVLRLCFLRIDGVAAAMHVAMVHGGGFWLLKIGYDENFARCSPGMLLIRESIAQAAREGLTTYEFLGKSESWIDMWSRQQRACVAVRVYPYNLRGMAALAGDGLRHCGARLARKLASIKPSAIVSLPRRAAKALAMPVMKRVARKYIAGDTLGDALRVQKALAAAQTLATIGFWDTASEDQRAVANQYLAGIDALSSNALGGYLSIKLPALRYSADLMDEVASLAHEANCRLHFDGMEPESADRTQKTIDGLLKKHAGIAISTTLPGRWLRSVADADWGVERQLPVRVVKGEWPDPDAPNRDLRAGYLEVVDRLAGRARHVSVASHDPTLVEQAIGRLKQAGTPCDIELLYGLPMRGVRKVAEKLGVGVRVYVPYGEAYMPYALGQIRRKPRILSWLAKDLLVSALRA